MSDCDWGHGSKTKTSIIYPRAPPFIQKTISLPETPIDLNKLLELPGIEWEPEARKPIAIRTKFGVIWIKSKNCIQISHVKEPDDMDKLEKFIHAVTRNDEKRTFVDWFRAELEQMKKDVGWDEFKDDIRRLSR